MDERTPGGLEMGEAMGRLADPSNLPPSSNEITVEVIDRKRARYKCGHKGCSEFTLIAFGLRMKSFAVSERPEFCEECLKANAEKDIIQCARCGLPIVPGEQVAIYEIEPEREYPPHSRRLENGVLGCMAWDCCPMGAAYYAGHWLGSEGGFRDASSRQSNASRGTAMGDNASRGSDVRVMNVEPVFESSTSARSGLLAWLREIFRF